jgi:hypothetical protein
MRAADLTGQQMAEQLGVSNSHTSRMLTGHRASDPAEVATFLAMCGAPASRREEIVALSRQDATPDLLRFDGAQRWISLREHAQQARQVAEFAPVMVPWGMQTPAYTAAVADAAGIAVDVVRAWGGYRVNLVELTERSRSGMWTVLLHEWALRTPVGGVEVMADQVHHLLRLSVHPAVTLRVIPASAGQHAGMTDTGLMVLEFDDLPSLVYREDSSAGVLQETRSALQQARHVIARLGKCALDPVDSRTFIRRLAVELYGDHVETDPDLAGLFAECGGVA